MLLSHEHNNILPHILNVINIDLKAMLLNAIFLATCNANLLLSDVN